MTRIPFSFGNAVSHFTKTGGPGGFLLKFALAYAAVTCLVQAVSIWLQWPVYAVYLEMFTQGGGDVEAYADDLTRASNQTMLRGLLVMPLGILVWLAFEAANQRRYMRGEGFSLRIGADEGRLFVVTLIWMALFIAFYVGLVIAVMIPVLMGVAMGENAIFIALLAGLLIVGGFLLLVLWIAARLSAAAALTVRDRQIRFFESWRVTKGKGWTIVGAWIVLGLILIAAYIVLYLVGVALGTGLLAAQVPGLFDGEADEGQILSAVISPAFWGPMAAFLFLFLMVQAIFMHVFSGPAALAARTDADWAGQDVAVEFQ